MNEYKVLSINPGASDRIPSYNSSTANRKSIVPWTARLVTMFGGNSSRYLDGSASRLLLRLVAAMTIGGSAWLQIQGHLCVFGPETYSYGCAIGALVLSVFMALGLTGRLAPLCLASLSVAALISYAYNHGGVADFSPFNQLALIYGALAATVAVLGTGRFTLPCWLLGKLKKRL